MNKYFKILPDGINRVFILHDKTRLDLRTGVPQSAYVIWKEGRYEYFALLPEAAELLSKETITSLIALAVKSKSVEDISIIATAKPDSVKLQEVAEKRIKDLTN